MSPRPGPAAVALRVVLAVLGTLMAGASRVVPRFRRQVTRDLRVGISTDDGVSRSFVFTARTRTMSTRADDPQPPDCALRFPTAWSALRTLLSPRAIGRVVDGMNTGPIRIDGNPVLVLWFHGLTRVVLPIGRTRLPRRPIPVPESRPERHAPYAARIVHEPPVDVLPREATKEWAARNKLLQIRAPAGEPLPPG